MAETSPIIIGDALRRRIEITTGCRDSDAIPRIAGAGTVESFRGRTVQIMHNGLRVISGGYYGEWMVEVIRRLRGCHEPQEEIVFWEALKRLGDAPVMIELGAYWSYYTGWFLKECPNGRAFCVEPDPNHLMTGQTNLELNGLHATFIQASVAATPAAPAPFRCESDWQIRQVPAVSVDGLVRQHGMPQVDVLLCDAQGAETAMLEGCLETIGAGKLRFVFISTHHRTISGDPWTHERCLARVLQLGGHVLAEHTVRESFSGDGLIAASFAADDRHAPAIPISFNRTKNSLWLQDDLDEYQSFRAAITHALRTGRRSLAKRLGLKRRDLGRPAGLPFI